MKYYYSIFVFLLVVAIAGSGLTGAAAVSDIELCPSDVDTQLLSLYNEMKEVYVDGSLSSDMNKEYRMLMLYFSNNIGCFCENKNYWQTMVKIESEDPESLSDFYLTFVGSLNNLYQQCPRNHPERSTADLTGVQLDDTGTPDLSGEKVSIGLQPGDSGTFIALDNGQGKISPPGNFRTIQFSNDLNIQTLPDCTSNDECEMIFTGECTLEISAKEMCEIQCPVDCASSDNGYSCPQ